MSAAAIPPATRRVPTGRARRSWRGWAFVGPFMLVFAVVFIAPILYSLYISMFRTQLVGGTHFVGFENYLQAFTDPKFWSGVGRVSLFLVVQVPVMLGLSMVVALAIDSARLYGKDFFRIAVFMPYAVPAVVAALMWGFMYGPRFGLVGYINDFFGWAIPNPLSPEWILLAIGNIVTWSFVGYNMLLFYSSLRTIPTSLYEAAELDGATQFHVIRHIKLPAIRGSIAVATIFSIIGSFQLFNEPSILRELAPNAIPTYFTPNLYAYSLSFSGQQYNYAAAVAIIMGVITMIIAYVVQLRGMGKDAS
ncbi:sugar ABC transporter permease [Microbacterium sp. zg-Y818]|uniref:carbohydrate ABC transporter permease n=1 Tax=unclassified Microbacterium TaxID=2609290 RepID=UPI00214B3213|nr:MULTISPECIES: sugar ABC transporter permease [unclassified Microbacterium]MCR2802117.1 sugar ABC transporter permease [Microbacterium sp. zg.Y818]WIM22665.1 sugar ABC transporter permease [Microbacterium sp. zg-Y818]